jgi:hypothetical protein
VHRYSDSSNNLINIIVFMTSGNNFLNSTDEQSARLGPQGFKGGTFYNMFLKRLLNEN